MIGFIAPNVHGYFYGGLLTGVLETAAARGGSVVAVQTHDAGITVFEKDRFAAQIGWDHLDALVVTQAAVDGRYLREFTDRGKPVVTVYEAPDDLACPTIVPDNDQGLRVVVDHLIGHGHTSIAFVGRDPANADDWMRYRAYRDAMLARGLEPWEPVLVPWRLDESYQGVEAAQALTVGGRMPTAVFACTDVTAMALINAFRDAGVTVPDDVAVVGFDDIAEAAQYEPALTTVSQSFTRTGAKACTLAFDALDGRSVAPGLHHTPVALVVRESCGCVETDREDALADSDLADVCATFVTALGALLYGGGELTPAQRRGVREAGRRLVALFTCAPDQDTTAAEDAATEALRRLVGSSPNPLGIVGPIQSLGQAIADRLGPGDVGLANRLERVVYAVSVRLLQSHRCHVGQGASQHAVVNQHVELQRRYYMISTELVRRYQRDFRSLAWLEGTEVHAACLALWSGGRGSAEGDLRVVGSYRDDVGERRDERCPPQAFPPKSVLDHCGRHANDLVFVQPVRFDGSDWGFLALTGTFDVRQDAAFERYNHWAVLLTVALDHEHAVRSERELLDEIRASEERYALAAEATNDGLWDWSLTSGTVYYSSRWKALLGYADDDIAATADEWLSRVHPKDRSIVDRTIAEHVGRRDPLAVSTMEMEYRLRAADGTYRWVLTRARSMRDEQGQVTRLIGSMTDVTERRRMEERLRRDAQHDALTGLPNRVLFLDRLNRAIGQADQAFAVVFVDLDGFKSINDRLGHDVGDEVLRLMARRLNAQVRANDTVARFGGDEFVLLLTSAGDPERGFTEAVDRLMAALSAPVAVAGRTVRVGASAGMAVSTSGLTSAEEYLRAADAAMYRAKSDRSSTTVSFDAEPPLGATTELNLESALDRR